MPVRFDVVIALLMKGLCIFRFTIALTWDVE